MTAAVLLDRDAELRLAWREAVIAEARDAVMLAMQTRVASFGADPTFRHLAAELAELLGCSLVEAGMLLHPVCQRAYAALGVANDAV